MSKRFNYIHDVDGSLIACVASSIDRPNGKIFYALSIVNEKHDQFNKRLGRIIAEGRLDKKPVVVECNVPEKGHGITKVIFHHLLETFPEPNKNTTAMKVLQRTKTWLDQADKPK